MKTFINPIIGTALLTASLVFNSCTTTLYTSNTVNAPLLKERGQIKVNATTNDLQGAVAVTNHIGVIANGYYNSHRGDNNFEHRGGLGELGIGYYTPFTKNLVFEAYAGGGLGKIYKQETISDANNNTSLASFDARGQRYFLQPGFGLSTNIFDIALTQRISFVKYTGFSASNYSDQFLEEEHLKDITGKLFAFAEPALTVRAGFKFIKIQAQYGLTVNMGPQIKHSTDFKSIGLVIDIR